MSEQLLKEMAMRQLTVFERWYGRDDPPPEIIKLRTGSFEMEFEDGDLRYLSYGDTELVRRIYCAVRDVNWNTIPAHKSNLSVHVAEDHFHIQFDARHKSKFLAFRWHASIEGRPDGTVEYAMNGVADSDFRYCRIGFCVLHPVEGTVGSAYCATMPQGGVTGAFSELIAPQHVVNGFEVPLFPSFSQLEIQLTNGFCLITDFEGDLFETEDQRNWTDGSFKTYCTPIALGYPHVAKAGQKFHQRVTIRADIPAAIRRIEQPEVGPAIHLLPATQATHRLPKIGFGMTSHGNDLSALEVQRLARLRRDHLKMEVHFQNPTWPADLDRGLSTARQLGCAVELAIFSVDEPEASLRQFKQHIAGAPVARVIVFHHAETPVGTTSARWMQMAREHLADALPGVPFVGGTNGNFAEINRQRPDMAAMDGIAYTINPQVHLPDERSLIEAIAAQGDTVATARSFCVSSPICISSVTLKPRFNQAATEAEPPADRDELPAAVDPRQMSLFAAAWTVGSLRALAQAGADSITYYEMTGWLGLMETVDGNPLPVKFRSFPGMLYPVYWVFERLAEAKESTVMSLQLNRPLWVEGLALQHGNRLQILVANLRPEIQVVRLTSIPNGELSVRRLNEDTMMVAATDPDAFSRHSEALTVHAGQLTHKLKPYETAFFELNLS